MIFEQNNIQPQKDKTLSKAKKLMCDVSPHMGDLYYAFDDYDIEHKTEHRFRITDFIELDYMDLTEYQSVIQEVQAAIKKLYWIFSSEQTVIFYGECLGNPNLSQWFIRTKTGEWFGIGWWGFILDVTGEYQKAIEKFLTPKPSPIKHIKYKIVDTTPNHSATVELNIAPPKPVKKLTALKVILLIIFMFALAAALVGGAYHHLIKPNLAPFIDACTPLIKGM